MLTALRRTAAAAAAAAAGGAAYHGLVEDVRRLPAYAWCVEALAVPLLRRLDAEGAHGAAVRAAALGLAPRASAAPLPQCLAVTACGLRFRSPIGLAAGFDKQAEAIGPLLEAGFGAVEVGTVTPQPQPGNPTPRMFRLEEDAAVINRFGFNSDGGAAVATRLAQYWGPLSRAGIEPGAGGACASSSSSSSSSSSAQLRGLVGVNIGKNKEGEAEADYVAGVLGLAPFADYLTINISSPNTPGLRALQGRAQLAALLRAVKAARDSIPWGVAREREALEAQISQPAAALARALASRRARPPPLFVKIAPDLAEADLVDIAAVVAESGIDGVIVSNTTLARPGSLRAAPELAAQAGGLSGAPLFEPSTRVLARLHVLTRGTVPLIGVGGVGSAEQAYDKIKAGATLVQVYTALAYSSALRGSPQREENPLQ
jgi:dihydroorotate dehydrogenase